MTAKTRQPKGKISNRRGMSLVEILIYIFTLVILISVVVSSLFSFTRSYRSIQSAQTIERSAMTALERMVREIRDSLSVDSSQSVFNAGDGVLTLGTTDDNGAATTVQFFTSGQRVHVKEAGVDVGALTASSARVTSLIFRLITEPQAKAIKIEMTIESGQGSGYKSKPFYTTVVLRGSYLLQ